MNQQVNNYMEQISSSPVTIKPISIATEEAVKYIKQRKYHEIDPLKSRWKKFNFMCGGGIEPGCVYTIAGASASGKSSFINTLETDLIELNSDKDIIVLSFSFEMLSRAQVGRKLSNKLHQATTDLYSATEDLSDEALKRVEEIAEELKKYPIFYVDESITVDKIEETITFFQNTIAKDKWLIVTLDHALLVNDTDYKDERYIISKLQKVFIKAKKVGKTSIIQLSQMNRNIESPERILNPSSHYPMRSDLSSSDSIFQGSDIVAVLSRPEMLNITAYGINKLPVQNKVYLHFLKVREGQPAILEYDNDLKYNNLIEVNRN